MTKQTKKVVTPPPLAYEIVKPVLDKRGRVITGEQYRYPVTGFTTPHLRNIREHILKRDLGANVYPPKNTKKKDGK